MIKIACIADLHINVFSKGNKMFPFIINFFKDFKQQCIDNHVDTIVIAGDLFDFKTTTQTEGMINLVKIIDDLAQLFQLYILPGNHDRASKDDASLSLTSIFSNKKNITVVEEYMRVQNFHFLPYYNDERFIEEVKKIEFESKKEEQVLFTHCAVKGFNMNTYKKDGKNVDSLNDTSTIIPKLFSKFTHVFLGDFHGYQSVGNITYVSSPFQLRHTDENTEHGFVIIEKNSSFAHEFYENLHTPNYCTIRLCKENMKSIGRLKNSYINLVIPSNINKEKVILVKEKLLTNNLDVSIINESDDNYEVAVVEGWDTVIKQNQEDLLKDFLKLNKDILDKNNWTEDDMFNLVISKE